MTYSEFKSIVVKQARTTLRRFYGIFGSILIVTIMFSIFGPLDPTINFITGWLSCVAYYIFSNLFNRMS
jgi:hypothetical protein